jgi:hypothetical protein
MKQIVTLSLLTAFFGFSQAGFASYACPEKGSLYLPTVELVKDGKHVLIVGFQHYGPKDYFSREKQAMKDWIGNNPSKVSILSELYTCKTSTLEIADKAQVEFSQVEQVTADLHQDETSVKSELGKAVSSRACQLDVDGENLRPAYVVDRNHSFCSRAASEGLGCQWNFDYPRAPNIVRRSGDLAMDSQPAASQLVGSLAYRNWRFKHATPEQLSKGFQDFMVDGRNQNLVNQTLSELKTSDRVILPWGAEHAEGVSALLQQQGFTVVKRTGVLFGNTNDKTLPQDMKGIIRYFSKKDGVQTVSNCTDEPTPTTPLQEASENNPIKGTPAAR